MEPDQKEHIERNSVMLVGNTMCNDLLLSHLEQAKKLTKEEVDIIVQNSHLISK